MVVLPEDFLLKRFVAFLGTAAGTGMLLVSAGLAAIICANIDFLAHGYHALLKVEFDVRIGGYGITETFERLVNDGLMALFFLLMGMEIKRELLSGELSSVRRALMPALAAIGGMIVPALIFFLFNRADSIALRGWAVPVATDIAFSLGVLSLLGTRVPLALRVFLAAIAVIDDLLAIVIIALFYTTNLHYPYLMIAAGLVMIMFLLNHIGVRKLLPYMILFALLWLCLLESGVHATIAGVLTAICVPHFDRWEKAVGKSPLIHLEHSLHGMVNYIILPLFAFTNAGIDFTPLSLSSFFRELPMGIALGLFIGKPIGICAAVAFGQISGLGVLPRSCTWPMILGVSLLCGIGFTVSLFIGLLAYANLGNELINLVKLGVLTGSIFSGLLGYFSLRFVLVANERRQNQA